MADPRGAGEPLPTQQQCGRGHAIEVRLCAGTRTTCRTPAASGTGDPPRQVVFERGALRLTTQSNPAAKLTPTTPCLGKLIVHAAARPGHRRPVDRCWRQTELLGTALQPRLLMACLTMRAFEAGDAVIS